MVRADYIHAAGQHLMWIDSVGFANKCQRAILDQAPHHA